MGDMTKAGSTSSKLAIVALDVLGFASAVVDLGLILALVQERYFYLDLSRIARAIRKSDQEGYRIYCSIFSFLSSASENGWAFSSKAL